MKSFNKLLILALVAALAFMGCDQQNVSEPDPSKAEAAKTEAAKTKAPKTESTEGPLPDTSIYQLGSRWKTQAGADAVLADFRGEPVLVTMFFGSCKTACPTLIADMKRVEKALGDNPDVKFVLITFDPERDTPEALKGLEEKFELDPERWTFLHGNPMDIREVAAVLGVQYREVSDGQFTHTNRMSVLDRNGKVVAKVDGLKQPVDALVAQLKSL